MKSNRRRPSIATAASAIVVAAIAILTTAPSSTKPPGGSLFVQGQAYVCDIVICPNGLFNQGKCVCECIPPYCPDQFGNCQSLAGNCGGNPWEECVRGINCPWWVNPLKAEGCTTGPVVPIDEWTIYNTREACCGTNFPNSEICDPVEPDPPTRYPTIALEDDDDEIIPLRIEFTGLPKGISMSQLKDELETVLKRILLRLAETVVGLQIMKLEERVSSTASIGDTEEELVYYNVHVMRVEDAKFGPTVITAVRDSYDEIYSQILTFSDTDNLGEDFSFNVCTMNKGEYDLCALEETAAPNPVPAPPPKVTIVDTDVDEDGGLAGWAIALIIILCLSLVCCGGYAIAVMCFGVTNCFKDPDDDGPKKIQNDLYSEDHRHNHLPLDYEKRLAIMDGVRSEADDRPRLAIMDGSVASRASRATSYNFTRRSGGPSLQRTYADEDNQMSIRSQDPSFATLSTYGSKRRQSRDPTMYIPGQEGRIDPGMSVNSFRTRGGESGRYYSDEPQMMPKREPTMYVDGKATGEFPASKYMRDSASKGAEGQQNPIMYEDVYSVEEDSYVNNNIHERYGMGGSNRNIEYERSEPNFARKSTADFDHQDHHQYDGSSYGEVESCRTQEPSASVSTAKSKKSEMINGHPNNYRVREPSVSGKSAFSKHSKATNHSSGVYSG